MIECSFLKNSGTLIFEIVKLSSKCKFFKTPLHQGVRISFQNGSLWVRSVTAKTGNDQALVHQSGGPRNVFIKNRRLSCIFLISCKAISLANLFFIKTYKIESRGSSWHKWSRKMWFKTGESDRCNGNYNDFKNGFLEIRKLSGRKSSKLTKNQKSCRKIDHFGCLGPNLKVIQIFILDSKIEFFKK